MNYKYLRDGRKVIVIGSLNNEDSIVQEIFVAEGGEEFPAGENFVARELLDNPAETSMGRELSRKAAALKNLKVSIVAAERKIKEAEGRLRKTSLYNAVLKIYRDKTPKDIRTLLAFMSGEITHLVFENYAAPEIVELLDALEYTEHRGYFSGLKLVSLFGVKRERPMRPGDKQLGLEWRISRYRDGDGGSRTIHPCQGLEEAVAVVDNILAGKGVSQKTIDLKEKYGLVNPTDERIQEWRQKRRKETEERIAKLEAQLAELLRAKGELETEGATQ